MQRHRLVKGCGDKLKEGEEAGTNGASDGNTRDDSPPDQGMSDGTDDSPRVPKEE